MSIEQLLKHVPAAAMYHRAPLSEEENALGPWREATARLVAPADDDAAWNRLHGDTCQTEPEGEHAKTEEPACGMCACAASEPPFVFPEGDDGRHVREIIEANRPALDLIDLGIHRGRLQLPECERVEDFTEFMDWIIPLRTAVRLLRARGMASAADGDFDAAGRDLVRILRVGEMLCSGDVFVVGYLVGIAFQGMAIAAMRSLAGLAGVPKRVWAELASAVRQNLARPDELARCLQFDFRFDLVRIDHFPDGDNLETLVDAWVQENVQETPWEADLDESQKRVKLEARRARCRREFLVMLEGHRRPLDKITTVRLAAKKVAHEVRLLSLASGGRGLDLRRIWIAWQRRRLQRWLRRQRDKCPEVFSNSTFWCMYADAPKSIKETIASGERGAWPDIVERMKPPTEEQLLLARRQLRRVDNPFGLLLASEAGADWEVIRKQQEPREAAAKRELIELLDSQTP